MRTNLLSLKSLLVICLLAIVGGVDAWAQATTNVYTKVTSVDELLDGGVYLFVGEKASTYYAMAQLNNNNRKSAVVSVSDNTISVESDKVNVDNFPYEFVIKKVEGGYKFYNPSTQKYLLNARTKTSKSNYLREGAETADGTTYAADYNETSETFAFTNVVNEVKSFIGCNYNNGSPLFSCYGSTSSSITYVQLYKKVGTVSVSKAGYATYYTDDAFVMPKGLTGYIITSENEGVLTLENVYAESTVVPSKTAVLLKGETKDYTYAIVSTEAKAPTTNLLHGTTTEDFIVVEGGTYKYYKLSYDSNGENLGFYYEKPNGAEFINGAHKAFLAIPTSNGASMAKGFALNDLFNGSEVTGINHATVATKSAAIYDLNGRRINSLSGAAKGIYIMNGQKVLVK